MTYFIAIQSNYHIIEIAFLNQNRLIDQANVSKNDASSKTVPLLEQLLTKNSCSVHDLSFIAINGGPGPSTTVRVITALINGISFSIGIPLVSVDGLALLTEYKDAYYPYTVALLNGFNHDVYFAISTKYPDTFPSQRGCTNIDTLLSEIRQTIPHSPIRFLGNGVHKHKKNITSIFGTDAILPLVMPETCSIAAIGRSGWKQWQKKVGICKKVTPLYAKKYKTESHL